MNPTHTPPAGNTASIRAYSSPLNRYNLSLQTSSRLGELSNFPIPSEISQLRIEPGDPRGSGPATAYSAPAAFNASIKVFRPCSMRALSASLGSYVPFDSFQVPMAPARQRSISASFGS